MKFALLICSYLPTKYYENMLTYFNGVVTVFMGISEQKKIFLNAITIGSIFCVFMLSILF